jgi:hypothetical protein
VAREVAANDHFHGIRLAAEAHAHHGVGRGLEPVGHEVGSGAEEVGRDAREHLALERDSLGQDVVEGGDAVACHHYQQIIANGVDIADLAVIDCGLAGEVEIGAY